MGNPPIFLPKSGPRKSSEGQAIEILGCPRGIVATIIPYDLVVGSWVFFGQRVGGWWAMHLVPVEYER